MIAGALSGAAADRLTQCADQHVEPGLKRRSLLEDEVYSLERLAHAGGARLAKQCLQRLELAMDEARGKPSALGQDARADCVRAKLRDQLDSRAQKTLAHLFAAFSRRGSC